jgi:hypothetical protein
MKVLIPVVFFLSVLTAKSQSAVYHPFPTTNANWIYQYYDDFHNPTGGIGYYRITGDTIKMGRAYKKISGCSGVGGWCNSGGIRDSNKVIYFNPDTCATEYVLYDFNLTIGDTLINPFADSSSFQAIFVIDVDSVIASDGYRRRLLLNTMDYWIEGIGSTHYFFSPAGFMGLSGNDYLECMWTDSGFYYQDGIMNCMVSVKAEPGKRKDLIISPNPFHSSALITVSPEISTVELRIYSTLGLLVRKENIAVSNGSAIPINRNELKDGIYFLRISSTAQQQTIKMIID